MRRPSQRPLSPPTAVSIVVLPYLALVQANGWFNGPLFRASLTLFLLVDALYHVVLPIFGVWFLATRAGIRPAQYGFPIPPPLARELPFTTFVLAVVLSLVFFIPQRTLWALSGFPVPSFSWGQVTPTGPLHGPVVLYLAVTAGVVESAVYLGLGWLVWRHFFTHRVRPMLFALISAAVFASVHWEQGLHGVTGAFAFGYVACVLYLRIRDLWAIAGAHAAVDVVAFW